MYLEGIVLSVVGQKNTEAACSHAWNLKKLNLTKTGGWKLPGTEELEKIIND